MCLGVPGRVVEIQRFDATQTVKGEVDFDGVRREVDLSFTPEVRVGDYVMVHVGFAISILDEEEARTTLAYLRALEEMPPGDDGLGSSSVPS